MSEEIHPSFSGGRDGLPPTGPRRQPKVTEAAYYKVMGEFEALLADATQGRHQQLPPGVTVPPPEYTANDEGANKLRPTSQTPSSAWKGSPMAYDSSFFRNTNFASLQQARSAGTPNSRASSSASSYTSEGRLAPPSRLAPLGDEAPAQPRLGESDVESTTVCEPIKPHRSLLGLLTSKLRRQPLSPRPHSVPVDIGEYQRHTDTSESLIIRDDTADDGKCTRSSTTIRMSPRPATTGEAPDLTRMSGGRAATLRPLQPQSGVLVDNKSAIDKEIEEIEKLQAQRNADRVRREEERADRRRRRELTGEESPIHKVPVDVAPTDPVQTIDDARIALLELIQQDIQLMVETQTAAYEGLIAHEQQQLHRIVRERDYEREAIDIVEEQAHQRRLATIALRAAQDAKYQEERERKRRWEIVRDTVVDEEQAREELHDQMNAAWTRLVETFYTHMDDPLMDVQVEERLLRCEHHEQFERDTFHLLEQRWILGLEALFRRRLERTWVSITTTNLTIPIMMYNRFNVVVLQEQQNRRHLLASHSIAYGVVWESFCEAVQPLVARALWKTATQETDARVNIERDETEEGIAAYHGCTSSRELVTRYAAVVREAAVRRSRQRVEAVNDILEDELAERILATRDEREGFILIEEMRGRALDGIRSNARRLHIQQAMDAAETLRLAEVQTAMLEEERQKKARAQQQNARNPPRPTETASKGPKAKPSRDNSASRTAPSKLPTKK